MSGADTAKRETILVTDDSPDNIAFMSAFLKEDYRVKAAIDAETALTIAASDDPPDIVLMDIIMPGIDGYEACRRLKENPKTKDIPVIFLTSQTDMESERRGFELGAIDFISRPIRPLVVKARVSTHLALKAARDILVSKSEWLEREVERRMRENLIIQDVAMIALGSLAETRDNETGSHVRRTQNYVRVLAERLATASRFEEELSGGIAELIIKSAPLHDIGKVGIPDSILLKPGPLTGSEFDVMKTHTTLGHEAIVRAETTVINGHSFLRFAGEIAYSHHEKWNGSGYPRGLAGEAIPLAGRLMAVADVYDALTNKRVYKDAMTHERSTEIIRDGSGTHFDPTVVEAFLSRESAFLEIARSFG
jgi:putative two-component system response regulator